MFLLPTKVSTVGANIHLNFGSVIRANATQILKSSLFNAQQFSLHNNKNPLSRIVDCSMDHLVSNVLDNLTRNRRSQSNLLSPSNGNRVKDTVNAFARFVGEVVDIFTDK